MFRKQCLWLLAATAAGIIYNSWILGYWLNPIVARHDLASELEALHQPFNWLFVSGDIICGSLITLLSYGLWRLARHQMYTAFVLLSYASFGLLTVADAVLPLHCDPSIQRCPTLHDPLLIAHGVCSIAASLGLFVAVVLLWRRQRHNWLLQLLIAGYVLFGIFSVVSLVTPGQDSWAQHYALLLDGACIITVPVVVLRQIRATKPSRQKK